MKLTIGTIAFASLPTVVLPAWALMWVLTVTIYAGCKWLTLRTAPHTEAHSRWRSITYLFAWPGMDAPSFLAPRIDPARITPAQWFSAVSKTGLGAALIWGFVGLVPRDRPMLAGWIGMLGLILFLHFGTFHLLALVWQRFGVNARPIMHNPIRATSLADFWSNRWNVAFHRLAEHLVFRPLHRRMGICAAMLATFTASGLLHDLVISVPAGAGYGLPTGYFVIQGIGVLTQRSRMARQAGLNVGIRGWLFTAALTVGPAYWLFHPPFVNRVIVPFLRAIGAM